MNMILARPQLIEAIAGDWVRVGASFVNGARMVQIGPGSYQNVKLDVLDPILDPSGSKNPYFPTKKLHFSFHFPKIFIFYCVSRKLMVESIT